VPVPELSRFFTGPVGRLLQGPHVRVRLRRCVAKLKCAKFTCGGIACALLLAGVSAQRTSVGEPVADFVDLAANAGLDVRVISGDETSRKYILESTGTGVAVFDYDNDGWPDIFFVNSSKIDAAGKETPSNRLFRNAHDGTFVDVTERVGLAASGWGQGVCVGDYDNDAWPDLYVTYYGRNRLYHNNHGFFENVTENAQAGGEADAWSTGCAFTDYDRDGLLDLFVSRYARFDLRTAPLPGTSPFCLWKGIAVFCGPRGLPGGKNVLFHNLGNGRFQNVSSAAHIDQTAGHFCFTASSLDYDEDGWPDIYVACDSAPSILYHNNRNGTFTDVAAMAGVAYNEDGRAQAGMGVAIADYDCDGHLDIFRTNFSEDTSTLYHNNGDGSFNEVTYASGVGVNTRFLGWGTAFFDLDDDGWPDLILANGHVYPEVDRLNLDVTYKEPRVLYRNNANGTFSDVSEAAGPGLHMRASGRGLATGDFWNDGRQSIVITNMNSTPSLLVNRQRSGNHWIEFKTLGTRSNRDGIGAKLTLANGSHQCVQEVRSGSSYISNQDRGIHFGLGPKAGSVWLEVLWPSGLRESFRDLSIDAIVSIKEGTGKPESVVETKR
jgi:enediyne biosynthesis protein E4